MRLDDGEHPRAHQKLRAAAESAKVTLSKMPQVTLTLEALADDRDYTLNLTR